MQRIGVAIGDTSGGMFWEALETLLESEPDIDIHRFSFPQELEKSLRGQYLRALILEKPQRWKFQPDYQQYFHINPGLAIFILDSARAESIVRFGALGHDLLMRLLRTLTNESDAEEQNKGSGIRVPSAPRAKRLAIKRLLPETTTYSPYASTREHLDDVREWLDLRLHQCLVRDAEAGGDVSAPEWAMSPNRARSLLGDTYASADEETLRRARNELEAKLAARESTSRQQGNPSKLLALAGAFGLTDTEWQIMVFTLAPELDGRYARVFGYLNDDLSRRLPTPSVLAQVVFGDDRLAWDIRQLLTNDGSLATYGLLKDEPSEFIPASEIGLKLAPEVVSYLLANPDHSPSYGPYLELLEGHDTGTTYNDPATTALQERLALWRKVVGNGYPVPMIQLVGNEASLRWFLHVATQGGDTVAVLNVAAILEQGKGHILNNALGGARVALLHDAILLVTGLSQLQRAERERLEAVLITRLHPHVRRLAIHSEAPWLLPIGEKVWYVERVSPGVNVRAKLWQERSQAFGIELSESNARTLGATVRFDEPEIDATLRFCPKESNEVGQLQTIQIAARRVARTTVPNAARRLDTIFDWDDIVLPEAVLADLRQIPAHVRHAGVVFKDRDYGSRLPYGQGVAALFSGPSGTGKTMAAQIVARELGVELFQVDLAKTVSKYIGETEKNLDRIFDAAERTSAVLLFDEADALFGKRTEVKDAHDRYANVEVAFLLQRMESYAGLAILTTNLKQNLDDSFLRRLRFVIDFPAPDALQRQMLWERVFPKAAPFSDDVDVTFLARRLKLTGGHIQQVAVHAAFAAAADSRPIAMEHIVKATRDQLVKLGMLNAERSLAEWLPALASGKQS